MTIRVTTVTTAGYDDLLRRRQRLSGRPVFRVRNLAAVNHRVQAQQSQAKRKKKKKVRITVIVVVVLALLIGEFAIPDEPLGQPAEPERRRFG
ncbi:MAG: hypothetical protein ACLSHG_02020 [Oscillospiraceae bacterium]